MSNVNRAAHGNFDSVALASLIMTNRKAKPTAADKMAARRLKAIWDNRLAKARLEGHAWTQETAGAEMGITQGAISQYLNGDIRLGYGAVLKFAKFLGVAPTEIRDDLDSLPKEADEEDFIPLRASTQGLAAGGGRVPDDYAETHKLMFRESSLRRKGLNKSNLQVEYVSGESMLPRLKDGDAVLIDKSDTSPIQDGAIYWIRHENHYFVKQLHKAGKKAIVIESMNKSDPKWRKPIVVENGDDFAVLGRVRWIGSWED
jgi:transcriptional regulator with XRE-family HTH domain